MGRKEQLQKKYQKQASESDIKKIDRDLPTMKKGPIAKNWQKVEALWHLIKDPKAAWSQKAVAIGALVYLISPVDAVLDVIPIAGLTDDLAVILAAVAALATALQKYTTETAKHIAEVTAEAQVKKYYRIVAASLLGVLGIAIIAILFKVAWDSLR